MTLLSKVSGTRHRLRRCLSVAAIACVLAPLPGITIPDASAADAQPAAGPAMMHLLSAQQYRQIIDDTFGPDIEVNGRFTTETRRAGLLAISSGVTSVTMAEMEAFDNLARSIAAQVTDRTRRDYLIPCKPASERAVDDACAAKFFEATGRFLFRRPLTTDEVKIQVEAAARATEKVKNFYEGLSLSLASMLASPEFLFRQEIPVSDPAQPGQYVLDSYSKASRLSFFLWNSQPDAELLRAAQAGDLNTPAGIAKQVDRMIASRRFEGVVRNFFSDMLRFDDFGNLQKDATVFPKFSLTVSSDAAEQTLLTLVDLLVTQHGDYRDIFTTRRTFLTTTLAAIYGVPLVKSTPRMEPPSWQPYEYEEGNPRAGILSHISFTALHSHPARTSATIRGKALREVFLCQTVPNPPANVNFTVVQNTDNPLYKTARERLTAHSTNPACAGCHKITDPIGLSLEKFDGSGSFRNDENGAHIDTAGAFNGKPFSNPLELGKVLHDDPGATDCLVTRAVSYALGREIADGEKPWHTALNKSFADDQYRLPELFRRIATSPEFFRTAEPQKLPVKTAASSN